MNIINYYDDYEGCNYDCNCHYNNLRDHQRLTTFVHIYIIYYMYFIYGEKNC